MKVQASTNWSEVASAIVGLCSPGWCLALLLTASMRSRVDWLRAAVKLRSTSRVFLLCNESKITFLQKGKEGKSTGGEEEEGEEEEDEDAYADASLDMEKTISRKSRRNANPGGSLAVYFLLAVFVCVRMLISQQKQAQLQPKPCSQMPSRLAPVHQPHIILPWPASGPTLSGPMKSDTFERVKWIQ